MICLCSIVSLRIFRIFLIAASRSYWKLIGVDCEERKEVNVNESYCRMSNKSVDQRSDFIFYFPFLPHMSSAYQPACISSYSGPHALPYTSMSPKTSQSVPQQAIIVNKQQDNVATDQRKDFVWIDQDDRTKEDIKQHIKVSLAAFGIH